jgi:hypothetical protein
VNYYPLRWQGKRIVRRIDSDGEYLLGMTFGFTFTVLGGILMLLLLATGCAPEIDSAEEVDDLAASWGVLEMPAWEIHTVSVGKMAVECRTDPGSIDACTFQAARVTWARNDLEPGRLRVILLHELGHLLRGGPNVHLECDERGMGDDVMCPAAAPDWSEPTDRDRAFVGLPRRG